jgi:hypothetical protein
MNEGEEEERTASTTPKQIRAEGADAEFPDVSKTREAGKSTTDRPA